MVESELQPKKLSSHFLRVTFLLSSFHFMLDPDPNPDTNSVLVPLRLKVPGFVGPVPKNCHFNLLWAVFLIWIRMDPCNDLALLVQDPVAMKLTNTIFFPLILI
jgi:hypothetical protein